MKASKPSFARVNLRLPAATRRQLDRSARRTGRTKSAIAAEAIEHHLSWRIAQQEELQRSIAQADRGEFADPKEVKALFAKYARG